MIKIPDGSSVVITCATQPIFIFITAKLKQSGFGWGTTNEPPWDRFGTNTCIRVVDDKIFYGHYDDYKNNSWAIMHVNAFMDKYDKPEITASVCPDCKGTHKYVGLLFEEPCRTCCKPH